MKKIYFVLLQNNYLLPFSEMPQKKGNYLAGVKLFATSSTTKCTEVCKWKENNFQHPEFTEVEDWE